MNKKIPFTNDNLEEVNNKTICYSKNDKLFLSNTIDIKHIDSIKQIFPDFKEIVYFEHNRPVCPNCGCEMNDNGSREHKPNKIKGIRKEQYQCPDCNKTHVTSLEPFISKYCNYSNDIAEKALNYDFFGLISYEKKCELIDFENDVQIPRQTLYQLTTIFSESFLTRQEKINAELLEQKGIKPTGYYHYDEQFPHENGEPLVRLALIDAINGLPINDIIVHKDLFDKDLVEAFLDSSLSGLPKEALVTDGLRAYPEIIDKISIKHQLCVFHIIKNHHDKTFKRIAKRARRIKTIDKKRASNKTTINMIKKDIKDNNYSKKKKQKKREKIKKLEKENRELKKERSEKKKELNELLKTNKCVENIYDADSEKSARRRFNTSYNRKEFLDSSSCSFFENLDKKFERTITYHSDPLIPKTNNNIERYFGITLPRYIKRRYRTIEGLTRWLRIQKIRWVRRNVLHDNTIKNMSTTPLLET